MAGRRQILVSRYTGVVATSVTDADEVERLAFELRNMLDKNVLQAKFRIHTTVSNEQLDALAYRYLGDTRLWWAIADVNRDVIDRDTLRIPAGTELMIPDESLFTG